MRPLPSVGHGADPDVYSQPACDFNDAFRLRARSDRVDRSDTIATIDTIAAETLSYPRRDRINIHEVHIDL